MDRPELETRVAEIAVLDQPLRNELYALLVARNGWLSRDEAAEELEISRSVVAFHLDKLAEAGLADVQFERPPGRAGPGAGRPAKLYRRSGHEVSVSLPDRRYDLAATILVDAVDAAMTSGRPIDEALSEAAGRIGEELAGSVDDDLADVTSVGDAHAFAEVVIDRMGYEPRADGDDLVLANCPFHQLAERHRLLVCGMNLDLLAGVLRRAGALTYFEPLLDPAHGMCCVRLRAKTTGD